MSLSRCLSPRSHERGYTDIVGEGGAANWQRTGERARAVWRVSCDNAAYIRAPRLRRTSHERGYGDASLGGPWRRRGGRVGGRLGGALAPFLSSVRRAGGGANDTLEGASRDFDLQFRGADFGELLPIEAPGPVGLDGVAPGSELVGDRAARWCRGYQVFGERSEQRHPLLWRHLGWIDVIHEVEKTVLVMWAAVADGNSI